MDTPNSTSTVGDLLLAVRARSGLTQEDVAERSGVSVRTISDLERHRITVPQHRTALALADALPLSDAERSALLTVRRGAAPAAPDPVSAAYHLPPDLTDLAGRAVELERLGACADEAAAGTGRAALTVVLAGPPGVGKTSLAIRAAHELADRFPDGQVFLGLRGFDPQPLEPTETLALLLSMLGLPASQVPQRMEERAAMFRGLVRDRAMLFVFDNAADEDQVRPLLVGSPRCLIVVTSRRTLAGLSGARRMMVGELADDEGTGLLAAIAGADRVAAEPAATADVVGLCGNLPIALRVVGNRLVSRPQWTIAALADKLRDERRRLSALTSGDLAVRPAFEMSYEQLSENARTLFRRLALVPGRSATTEEATYLLGADPDAAERALDELLDSSLLRPASRTLQFEFHDLLRVFAAERLTADEPPETVRALDTGIVDRLLSATIAAGNVFELDPAFRVPAADLDRPFDLPEALDWLLTETHRWMGAVRRAAAAGRHRLVADVAIAVYEVSDRGGDMDLWDELYRLGLASAQALGDPARQSRLLNQIGWVDAMVRDDLNAAYERHLEALARAEAADVPGAAADSLRSLAVVDLLRGDHALAAERTVAAIGIMERLGHTNMLDNLHAMHAAALTGLGDNAAALAENERGVGYARDHIRQAVTDGGHGRLGHMLRRLGNSLATMGRWEDAVATYREAVASFQVDGDRIGLTTVRLKLGQALHRLGDLDAARAELHAAHRDQDALLGWPLRRGEFLSDVAAALAAIDADDPGDAHHPSRAAG